MQKCPKCDHEVEELGNPLVITVSRLDDTETQKALAPSLIVKICTKCGALFVGEEHINWVKTLLDL